MMTVPVTMSCSMHSAPMMQPVLDSYSESIIFRLKLLVNDQINIHPHGGTPMELWDAYTADGDLAGCDLTRGNPVPAGLYHLVSEVLVRHADGSYLLMRRDDGKPAYPGFYEATAGGSALKGETSLYAALRELKEETGLSARGLTHLGRTLSVDTIYDIYLCVTDCDKSSVTLQPGETTAYKWVTRDEFHAFMDSGECIPPQRDRLHPWLEATFGAD